MSHRLSPILSRWESNPPTIYAREAHGELHEVFATLREQSLVRSLTPAGAANCTECSRRCRVEFVTDTASVARGFIDCPDCGLQEVPPRMLARWEIDTPAMLAALFRDAVLNVQQRVPHRLWHIGKATWAGRSRELWFARAVQLHQATEIVNVLRSRPKAILFTPTEIAAERCREATGNLVIPLEAAIVLEANTLGLDVEYIEGRICDAGLTADTTPIRRPKKRAVRAANIEALRKALIEHLRAARDHAFATEDLSGQSQLLPRPTQKALGQETGLTESDVSRCFKDPEARELRIYWEIASDLEQLRNWRKPVSLGRKP